MAGHFKKRKGYQGPNKNEQKVTRGKNADNQARVYGVLGAKFPLLKRLKIGLTFLNAQQQMLDQQTMSLGPTDAAVFTVPCPGRCGRGSFDFGGKIAETVGAGLLLSESSAKCPESLYAGSPETCGCEIKCRMEADYLPAPAPTPALSGTGTPSAQDSGKETAPESPAKAP